MLLVVDEAHRATGKYAFCNIISQIEKKGQSGFRILSLSATPTSKIDMLQGVIENLRCRSLEIYDEDDEEIKKYIYDKDVTELLVPKFDHINEMKKLIFQILDF